MKVHIWQNEDHFLKIDDDPYEGDQLTDIPRELFDEWVRAKKAFDGVQHKLQDIKNIE